MVEHCALHLHARVH